ncbi:hypothetical protein SNEBB_005243, partial [Seison nebaliae]
MVKNFHTRKFIATINYNSVKKGTKLIIDDSTCCVMASIVYHKILPKRRILCSSSVRLIELKKKFFFYFYKYFHSNTIIPVRIDGESTKINLPLSLIAPETTYYKYCFYFGNWFQSTKNESIRTMRALNIQIINYISHNRNGILASRKNVGSSSFICYLVISSIIHHDRLYVIYFDIRNYKDLQMFPIFIQFDLYAGVRHKFILKNDKFNIVDENLEVVIQQFLGDCFPLINFWIYKFSLLEKRTQRPYNIISFSTHKPTKRIGGGHFATVWSVDDWTAMKILKNSDEVRRERRILILLENENITKYFGHSAYSSANFLIFKLYMNGSLEKFLRRQVKESKSLFEKLLEMNDSESEIWLKNDENIWKINELINEQNELDTLRRLLVKFTKNILKGLCYLHSKYIIHMDLAARNILINDDGESVVISDFGLSRNLTKTNIIAKKSDLPSIIPMFLDTIEDYKTDIYMFGYLLNEIFSFNTLVKYCRKKARRINDDLDDG